jgi:hypothetical protein
LSKLEKVIAPWLTTADTLFSRKGSDQYAAAKYGKLRDTFHSTSPNEIEQRILALNVIHSLANDAVAACVNDPDVNALGRRLTETFNQISDLQCHYNDTAARLNRILDAPVSGYLGRKLGFRPLPKLRDLSVL